MFLFTSVDRTPMDKASSRRVTYEASVCNVVLDVHVKRYDMCMWDSTTCASHAALHVHLKQDCTSGKHSFLRKTKYNTEQGDRCRLQVLPLSKR